MVGPPKMPTIEARLCRRYSSRDKIGDEDMNVAGAGRQDRLWQRHADMAKLGGTPKGGVNRQALSAEDAAAPKLLASLAKARGFSIFTHATCNLFPRPRGREPS